MAPGRPATDHSGAGSEGGRRPPMHDAARDAIAALGRDIQAIRANPLAFSRRYRWSSYNVPLIWCASSPDYAVDTLRRLRQLGVGERTFLGLAAWWRQIGSATRWPPWMSCVGSRRGFANRCPDDPSTTSRNRFKSTSRGRQDWTGPSCLTSSTRSRSATRSPRPGRAVWGHRRWESRPLLATSSWTTRRALSGAPTLPARKLPARCL